MKTRYYRFLFFLLFAGCTVPLLWSQPANAEGKAKIATLLAMADSSLTTAPDISMGLAERALAEAEQGQMPDLIADAELILARAYMNKGYYNRGLKAGFNALRYYESVRDTGAMGEAKHRISTIYLETENETLAQQYENASLELLLMDPQKDTLA
jgi:hypothetical protein